MSWDYVYDEDEEYEVEEMEDEPEEGEEMTELSDLGVELNYEYRDGEWVMVGYENPSWEYLYDEDGDTIQCPSCGDELRYHDGQCCCISCDRVFDDDEIEDIADEWDHR